MRNVSHGLAYLSTWPQLVPLFGEAIKSLEGAALLENVYLWVCALRVHGLSLFSVQIFSASHLQSEISFLNVQIWSPAAMFPLPLWTPHGTVSQNKLFLL